jgi:aminopeptidase N
MDWFFEQYIYRPGHPEFEIGYDWSGSANAVRLKVKQVQDFSLGIPVYRIPVIIGITTSKGKINKQVWIEEEEEVFEFAVNEKPLLVRFDEGNFLLKEWSFDKGVDELLYQLKNDDVIGRMWAATELGKSKGDPRVGEALTERMQDDPFWAVRRSALEALGEDETDPDVELLKNVSEDENSKVRTAALRILGDTGDAELVPFFKDRFEEEDSYAAQAEALRSVGKCGDSTSISFLNDAAEMTSPRNVIQRAADWALKEIKRDGWK